MKKNKSNLCPICRSQKAINFLNLDCGNLDKSILYQFVKLMTCTRCGHFYNLVSHSDALKLKKYYNEESAPLNLSLGSKSGDRPGHESPFSVKRYKELYQLISPFIKKNFRILDIGCATGGFLNFLYKKGYGNLYGIDIVKKYVNFAKKKYKFPTKLADVQSIPLHNKSVDLVIMDQVIEHLAQPKRALKEIKRVLSKEGLLCLGLPDASKYNRKYFFDFFWFLIREHIQHFDIEHLSLLAKIEGFKIIKYSRTETPVVSEKMILPILNIVFRFTNKIEKINIPPNCFNLKKEIKKYIKENNKSLNKKIEKIKKISMSQKPLYIWGIGREFLFLYESAGLNKCKIVGLIDGNPYKRGKFLSKKYKITNSSILRRAPANSTVLIMATAHIKLIKNLIKKLNFKGKIINI